MNKTELEIVRDFLNTTNLDETFKNDTINKYIAGDEETKVQALKEMTAALEADVKVVSSR